jgi:hypothetical protein
VLPNIHRPKWKGKPHIGKVEGPFDAGQNTLRRKLKERDEEEREKLREKQRHDKTMSIILFIKSCQIH